MFKMEIDRDQTFTIYGCCTYKYTRRIDWYQVNNEKLIYKVNHFKQAKLAKCEYYERRARAKTQSHTGLVVSWLVRG